MHKDISTPESDAQLLRIYDMHTIIVNRLSGTPLQWLLDATDDELLHMVEPSTSGNIATYAAFLLMYEHNSNDIEQAVHDAAEKEAGTQPELAHFIL